MPADAEPGHLRAAVGLLARHDLRLLLRIFALFVARTEAVLDQELLHRLTFHAQHQLVLLLLVVGELLVLPDRRLRALLLAGVPFTRTLGGDRVVAAVVLVVLSEDELVAGLHSANF